MTAKIRHGVAATAAALAVAGGVVGGLTQLAPASAGAGWGVQATGTQALQAQAAGCRPHNGKFVRQYAKRTPIKGSYVSICKSYKRVTGGYRTAYKARGHGSTTLLLHVYKDGKHAGKWYMTPGRRVPSKGTIKGTVKKSINFRVCVPNTKKCSRWF